VSHRFDPAVLSPDPPVRARVLDWLEAGLSAVDPEPLTARALAGRAGEKAVVIAIGKGAPAMARGAAQILDVVGGVCVSDHVEPAPDSLRFMIGDHPIPGRASREAALAVRDAVSGVNDTTTIVALVSGGGSALCELPRDGVSDDYLAAVNGTLMAAGAGIEEINLVRAHLSAIKCGGVSRAAGRPIDTYVLSDVCGADPGIVASGPTVPRRPDPEAAVETMTRHGIEVPPEVRKAMSLDRGADPEPKLTVIGDGRDAARAIAAAAPSPAVIETEWLDGEVEECVERFLSHAGPGVTVGVGETVVELTKRGRGGRNTHAALVAAIELRGSNDVFIALATDGVDGWSGGAGAIVDGGTVSRGGDPEMARSGFDSASYLTSSSDLLRCGPTGTNVADIWVLWRRSASADVE
jgi:hydroxypyruvate reductase